jgi:catechol 2,3-dioxygenase-like lactoylglutathione lyase family enzyme
MIDKADAPVSRHGLRVQPMVHVKNMAGSIDFYEALGGRVVFGSRDGDWALLDFQGSTFSLLARPPGDGMFEAVELHFTCPAGLDEIESQFREANPSAIERGVADEAFGRMLKLRTPDGMLIKILELERDLIE